MAEIKFENSSLVQSSDAPPGITRRELLKEGGKVAAVSSVFSPISDSIQACQLGGADPKQTAEQGAEQIDSFLAGYSGAPLL